MIYELIKTGRKKWKRHLFDIQLLKRRDPSLDFSSAAWTNCFDPNPTPLFTCGCLYPTPNTKHVQKPSWLMRSEYRKIILESRYKRDSAPTLCRAVAAFQVLHHCSKIGAMTHISNNLAVRLSIGVLQRKWRMRGLAALSNVHPSTSKLTVNRLTCF